jgi:mRNA interferase RelE/StbE
VTYALTFKIEAEQDLRSMSPDVARRILRKTERLRHGLAGDVKRLVNYTPGFRLRVGDWRVLFHVQGNTTLFGGWCTAHRLTSREDRRMLKIKPEIWTRNGREAFVVMSLSDFEKLEDLLEDAGLSRILREARRQNAKSPTISLTDMRRRLGLASARKKKVG